LISSRSSLEDLVKVFSEVIERIDVNETLSSTLEIVLRQGRVLILRAEDLQGEYKKRELAVPFSFWFVFILTKYCDNVTM